MVPQRILTDAGERCVTLAATDDPHTIDASVDMGVIESIDEPPILDGELTQRVPPPARRGQRAVREKPVPERKTAARTARPRAAATAAKTAKPRARKTARKPAAE